MIVNSQVKITFDTGKTFPANNLNYGVGTFVEFDCNEKHYLVKLSKDSKFETFIGVFNEDELYYKYEKQSKNTVVKIFVCQELIDNYS